MASEFKIKTYNQISDVGVKHFKDNYKVSASQDQPDAIMLRSFDLHKEPVADSVLAVGRAGAGVNNIPVEELSKKGIVVFSAPGANANSVKELVIAGMLVAGRNIAPALIYTQKLSGDNIKEEVEAGKKKFAGSELAGKTIGIIGLGAIGHRVANSALDLGMKVLGYDPAMTVENAWRLSPDANHVTDIDQLLIHSDYITIHVPLLPATTGLINKEKLSLIKPGAVLLNFSRDELVDENAVMAALNAGEIKAYVTDFPNKTTIGHNKVIALPHLGASTSEAEDNCAVMIAEQLQDFLENGNIRYSVNMPEVVLPRVSDGVRLSLVHSNEPGVVAKISSILSDSKINIIELLNKSRGGIAYTLIDADVSIVKENVVSELESIPTILKVRVL